MKWLVSSTIVASLLVVNPAVAAEIIGEQEFMKNCAVCHGSGGKGNGSIIDFLKESPADLTQIRKNNNERFPMQATYEIIVDAGRTRAHGNKDMPIWGDKYAQEIIEREGEFGMNNGSSSKQRVLELVFYLATIQE